MIINDISTTISCSRCSGEHTIEGKLYAERTMRRLMKRHGWQVINDEDVCPDCIERERLRNLHTNGHFTATQLISFSTAAADAHNDGQTDFACPVCGSRTVIRNKLDGSIATAQCSGCGIVLQNE